MPGLIAGPIFNFLAGTLFIGVNTATLIANAIGNLVVSLLATAVSNALTRRSAKQAPLKAGLGQPTSIPPYRFVYGRDLAIGSPAPWRVRGAKAAGCWILNSRASAMTDTTLYLDKRAIALTGDPFNFAGSGAVSADPLFSGGNLRVWYGRGNQTTPPAAILTEFPWAVGRDEELFLSTDGWRGRTVIWAIMVLGSAEKRSERWPTAPNPPLVEVLMDGSLVCNPANGAHNINDPTTWAYSNFAAQVILDAARTNPIKPYRDVNLVISQFVAAGVIDEQSVTLKSGGSEARYRINGTLIWADAELEDQLGPLYAAAAAQPLRVGGRLGILPGAYIAPTYTLTDVLRGGFESVGTQGGDLPNQIRTSYTSPARLYEVAELTPYDIPGALAADGGLPSVQELNLAFAGSATQAMRVQKIAGGLARRQKTFAPTAPGSALTMVAGSTFTVDAPGPWSRFNGTFQVQSMQPTADPLGDGGVAMRCPLVGLEHSETPFLWVAATDEQDLTTSTFTAQPGALQMPGAVTATTGAGIDLDTGGTVIPRFRFAFNPSTSGGVIAYEWQWRRNAGDWSPGGSIDGDVRDTGSPPKVFDFLIADDTGTWDIRVRSVAASGARSDWQTISGLVTGYAVSGVTTTQLWGAARLQGTAPTSVRHRGIEIHRTAGAAYSGAVIVRNEVAGLPGAAFNIVAGLEATVNQIANSGFATNTIWTLGADWAIGSGVATHTAGAADRVVQAEADFASGVLIDGVDYRMSADLTRTAGGVFLELFGSTNAPSGVFNASGLVTATLTAPTTANQARVLAQSTFVGTIDNVVLFAADAAHLTQGLGYYWIVPVLITGAKGEPSGPYAMTIR